jgi:hypothetical protein
MRGVKTENNNISVSEKRVRRNGEATGIGSMIKKIAVVPGCCLYLLRRE